MSNTVWTAANGWHDGPEVQVSSVGALNDRHDLSFVSDSQDVEAVRENFGSDWHGREYDSYFVACGDGDYSEIWGMSGIVPYLHKFVTRLV